MASVTDDTEVTVERDTLWFSLEKQLSPYSEI